jgi:hypothetical protein
LWFDGRLAAADGFATTRGSAAFGSGRFAVSQQDDGTTIEADEEGKAMHGVCLAP